MNELVLIAEAIMTFSALCVLFIKPIRERLFKTRLTIEGEKCLLRSELLRIYYRGKVRKELRQYDHENFIKLYEAYKSLGGNSFIDNVYSEVQDWEITT